MCAVVPRWIVAWGVRRRYSTHSSALMRRCALVALAVLQLPNPHVALSVKKIKDDLAYDITYCLFLVSITDRPSYLVVSLLEVIPTELLSLRSVSEL